MSEINEIDGLESEVATLLDKITLKVPSFEFTVELLWSCFHLQPSTV